MSANDEELKAAIAEALRRLEGADLGPDELRDIAKTLGRADNTPLTTEAAVVELLKRRRGEA